MLDYIKSLITPDMVFFGVPSGQSRAMNLVRPRLGGQCYGTHPNVPVISTYGDEVITGDSNHFTASVGNWSAQRGTFVVATGEGKFTTNDNSERQYIRYGSLVIPGRRYILTFDAKSPHQTYTLSGSGRTLNFGGTTASAITNPALTSSMQSYVFVGTCGALTHVDISFGFQLANGNEFYVDNISLIEIIPSLTNTSLGWHLEGTDDWIAILTANLPKANDEKTIGAWIKRKSTGALQPILSTRINFGGVNNSEKGYGFQVQGNSNLLRYNHPNVGAVDSTTEIDTNWHFVVVTVGVDAATPKLYLNATLEVLSGNTLAQAVAETTAGYTGIGRQSATYGDIYICMPFMTNQIWSAQKINNFYIATKGLFAPRG